jgi:hypothetical protein
VSEKATEVLTALGAVTLLLPSSTVPHGVRDLRPVLNAARDIRQRAKEERAGGNVAGICCVVYDGIIRNQVEGGGQAEVKIC